jgi:prepilin-type N-terminal cleavage/methylation domain-containing protein
LRRSARRAQAGFTLIEVVVALALLGLVLAVLSDGLRTGLSSASRAAAIEPPLAVAQAKLAEVGVTEPLTTGITRGQDARGIQWQLAVDDYDDSTLDAPATDAPGVPKLYRVTVTVSWLQGRTPRSLSLATLRVGPVTLGAVTTK